jgi:metalloendopeptidase OMA1, mitochondrial
MNYRHAHRLYAAAVLVILTLAIGVVANAAGLSFPGMDRIPAPVKDRIPVPGKDLQVLPDAAIDTLAKSFYYHWIIAKAQQENKIVNDPRLTDPVKRVWENIKEAAIQSKYGKTARECDWDLRVIRDDAMENAFTWPGCKTAVYTGILPIAQNEAGLAFVLAHEATHALARHAARRIDRDVVASLPIASLAAGTMLDPKTLKPEVTAPIIAALGMGALVGIDRPLAREHELEADSEGLLLAAAAGYDPAEGKLFWSRLPQSAGAKAPKYLSAHPSDATRLKALNDRMDEFVRVYNQAKVKRDSLVLLPSQPGKAASR